MVATKSGASEPVLADDEMPSPTLLLATSRRSLPRTLGAVCGMVITACVLLSAVIAAVAGTVYVARWAWMLMAG